MLNYNYSPRKFFNFVPKLIDSNIMLLMASFGILTTQSSSISACDEIPPPQGQTDGSYFKCNSGLCIPTQWLCDGLFDCWQREDEQNCKCDSETQFLCESGGGCLEKSAICDGSKDCLDGEDEENCTIEDKSTGKVSGESSGAIEVDCERANLAAKRERKRKGSANGINQEPDDNDNTLQQDEVNSLAHGNRPCKEHNRYAEPYKDASHRQAIPLFRSIILSLLVVSLFSST